MLPHEPRRQGRAARWRLAAATLLAALASPTTAHATEPAPDDPCLSAPLVRVEVRGCESTHCPTAADRRRFIDLIDTPAGAPLTPAALARVRARVAGTGLFGAVALRCEAEAGGVALAVEVAPQTLVRRVRIRGNAFFKRRDLLKRVFLRAGTPLEADPARPEASEQLQRQVASLERLYATAGLDDVTIRVVVDPVEEGAADLEFVITEGERARLEALEIAHRHVGAPDPDGLSCPRITQARLERLAGVEFGAVATTNLRRQVRERLRRAFQAVGFTRPRFDDDLDDDDPATLRETITTDRCWVIRVWERDSPRGDTADAPAFLLQDPVDPPPGATEGSTPRPPDNATFRRAPLEEWLDALPFAESGVFDREEASRGVDAILARLRAAGFAFAEVTLEHRPLALRAERRGVDSEVRGVIDYTITRNHARRIQGIDLVGAETFAPADLLRLLETRVYDFFGASGVFDVERFFIDLAVLERHYRDRGFYDFAYDLRGAPDDVEPTRTLERSDDDWIVWRYTFRGRGFRLEKRRGEHGIYLVVPFTEGPRTVIDRFDAVGMTRLDDAAVRALTGLGPGQPFGKHQLERAIGALDAWYRRRGYHHVVVEPFCEAHASRSGDGSFCNPRGLVRADRVDLGLRVREGTPVTIGLVFWRGNFRTDPHALLRDLPRRGDPLDQTRLDDAMRRMRALGLFNSVRIDTIGLDEDPPADEVALVISVEETGYRFFDLAAGVRSIQRLNLDRVPPWAASAAGNLVGNVDRATTGFGRAFPLDIPDVLLLLEAGYVDLNLWGLGHRLELPLRLGASFSEPLRLASFTPTYVWPRLLDSDLQLEGRLIAELDRVTDPLDRVEFSLETDLLFPISPRMLAGFTLKGGVLKLAPPSELGQLLDLGDGLQPQFRVSLRWRWDEQDNPLHPREGFALTAGTSLIWDRDRRTGDFNQFLKWELSARLALDLGGPIVALFARYGGSRTFGQPFLPANERYTLGGSNGLRGFADNAVCRYAEDGTLAPTCPGEFGGNVVVNGSFELRVPLLERLGVWAATFVDAGALADSHETLYAASFRASFGVGLRWLIGGQIPIRLDVGFPLGGARCLTQPGDEPCLTEDRSSFHFDFLYPF